jgi:eukaryotic-like serine/threonine-protein kinase
VWPTITAVFALATAALALLHFRETPPELRAVNTTLLPPENAEFDFTTPFATPALSPDGTRIVFGAKAQDGKQQLWLRRLDSPTAQPLPGTDGAASPFWSPDSRWVAFGQETKLKKIDIQGGPPVAITDLLAPFRGGSWSPQGVIVFGVNGPGPILRVAAAGGTAVPATAGDKNTERVAHRYPWFLPDGRHFLYTNAQTGDIPVRVGSLDEPAKPGKVVAQAHSTAAYSQRHLLYLRENTLMAQPFDLDRWEATGEAVPVA